MAKKFCEFPSDFLWGASTAAYQIEGAADVDGRGPSVWDTFSHRPGAVAMDHTGDVATDHYHRFKEDVALMKDLGLKAYRFSISWSRLFPADAKSPNAKGLYFYKRLLDELNDAGIQPWATLFHWDLPQWCEDAFRGWESIECANAFASYADYVAKNLGDRVAGFMTINEFVCFLDVGYAARSEPFAPGKNVSKAALNQARHHAVLAHGMGVEALRAGCRGKCPPVGLAENIPNIQPVLESADHVHAAKQALRELAGMFLTPIMEGAYHPAYLKEQAADAPKFTDAQMKTISTKLDFVGLNLYAPMYVRHDESNAKGWSVLPCDEHYPRMFTPWLNVGPAMLYWCVRMVHELWRPPAIYITENGAANADKPDANNEIWDTARVMYLQNHLIHAHRATAEGIPLKGYFLWSLLDNFEWAQGYTKRFGLHYVNYQSLTRTPKLSAKFYKEVIARNAVGFGG